MTITEIIRQTKGKSVYMQTALNNFKGDSFFIKVTKVNLRNVLWHFVNLGGNLDHIGLDNTHKTAAYIYFK